jgi:hypothetical protein
MSDSDASDQVAPSGIGAAQTVAIEDARMQHGVPAISTKVTPSDVVISEGVDPEQYKTNVGLVEKLREIIGITYKHASEASVLIAYIHWYGDLIPMDVLRSKAQLVGSWTEAAHLVAVVTTQFADIVCGANVEINYPRQNSMELCYSLRWPLPLTPKHSTPNYCRGSRAVVLANASRYAELGWLTKDVWAFKPEKADEVFDHLQEHMKNLQMCGQALKMAGDKFRKEKSFSDLDKLYEYLFQDIPVLTTPNFCDYLWRIYQILLVFANPSYSDKRQYSADDKKLLDEIIEKEQKAEEARLQKAVANLKA